ncbi:hypothetical protein ACJIZ3_000793 [Penstemon smallii]|uniref:Uncharacterized protein n=1 Tax=Penstemon smallii TaxID=265156 RepID=A0ABD3U317_9LAMI
MGLFLERVIWRGGLCSCRVFGRKREKGLAGDGIWGMRVVVVVDEVARVSAFSFGIVYGSVKLKFLQAKAKSHKKAEAKGHH